MHTNPAEKKTHQNAFVTSFMQL